MLKQAELIHKVPWRQLIILDACRHDYLEELWDGPGKVGKVESPGSCTLEWAPRTWPEKYDDIVYLSTIPFISALDLRGWKATEHFFRVVPLWKHAWSEENGTVMPGAVVEALRVEAKLHPGKRFVVHFAQPHSPYVGVTKLDVWSVFRKCRASVLAGGSPFVGYERKAPVAFDVLRRGYRDNVALVLEHVYRIFGGRSVVTADHGELLGERGGVVHPPGRHDPELRHVPWVVGEGLDGFR